jgi:hypothetical protein
VPQWIHLAEHENLVGLFTPSENIWIELRLCPMVNKAITFFLEKGQHSKENKKKRETCNE